ncbi:MAG: type I DNA topoisomerase [Bacilli bacterium]|nr:type I DNA topoisomerase [Bacilli bacterium]
MKLVIVESPTKSEVISRFLGKEYKVIASEGHIRDLSTSGKGGLGIVVEEGFRPLWTIPTKKRKLVSLLSSEAKKSEEVILATDPDREGEAISWHLAEVLNLPVDKTKRVTFEEITKDVVLESVKNPRTIDVDLVHAQEARRMEDRIVGFKLSTLLQRKIGLKSAGRVQSAALRLIVDRQEEIDDYESKKQEYWTIDVMLKIGKKTFRASLTKVDGVPIAKKIDELNKNATNISSKELADMILARIPEQLTVTEVTGTKGVKTYPSFPFTTSTMQQLAYSKFGFSNAKTQSLAQRLFEGNNSEHIGLITYLRTDSTRISPHFYEKHAVPYIKERFGDEYIGPLRAGKKTEGEQGAHEAIRPTGTHRTPEIVATYVTPDEAKLYRLIYCRALASTMAPKISDSSRITLEGNGLEFVLTGSKTVFPGFMAIYGEFEEDDDVSLPDIKKGDSFPVDSKKGDQKFTKANPPFNEASIVKTMEENGIGRPSTYATTVETLIKRKYITAKRGVLSPTESGKKCIAFLESYFPDVVDLTYTADMEGKLDKIADDELDFLAAMTDFYEKFNASYEAAKTKAERDVGEPTGEMCPECGRPLVRKRNKQGSEFIGCSGWPECNYIKREAPKEVGEVCPDCGSPLIFKKSKRGSTFIGCSNFPKCKFTASSVNEIGAKKEPTVKKEYSKLDIVKPCPKCGGSLVVKKGKRAEFLGCTNWPKCHYHEWIEKKGKSE